MSVPLPPVTRTGRSKAPTLVRHLSLCATIIMLSATKESIAPNTQQVWLWSQKAPGMYD